MLNVWSVNIQVIDNFVEDASLYEALKEESIIQKTVQGQNTFGLTEAQQAIMSMVNSALINYCFETNMDYNTLEMTNLQKGCLYKYDEKMVSNHLYEPHHDIAENAYVSAIYYIDSDWNEDNWVGGELTLYKHMTFVDYPENIVNVLPKQNRLIIFPGFITHRVKPYFGDKPRTSLVFGWKVEDAKESKVITI